VSVLLSPFFFLSFTFHSYPSVFRVGFADGRGSAGVPQVVLPVWIDCFDFANRAEMLGIGLWGNKSTVPKNSASELGPAMIEVLLGSRSNVMRNQARDLAEVCRREGEGRVIAARAVMQQID
jgi:UDP:flavonoid glycosyltransferase YjiC (YdhE family)